MNAEGDKNKNYDVILRRADGAWVKSPGFDQAGCIRGDLRLDPSPLWNRDSTQILVPGQDSEKTRPLWIMTIKK